MKLTVRVLTFFFVGVLLAFRLGGTPRTRRYSHQTVTHHTRSGRTYTRSPEVRREFQREHPCPSTGRTSGPCFGYTVDHVNPLACGGADSTENMSWQTNAAAHLKDQWEMNCKGHP